MFALLIPTGSDHERQRLPMATLSLIALNLALDLIANLGNYRVISEKFGFVAAQPHWWQFVTHMFLHAGWPTTANAEWTDYANCLLHIAGNMAYLWFAGSDLEDVLGPGKFLALYFLGGIASALLFWVTAVAGQFPNLHEPAVGASGAVSALLGFYVVRFLRFKVRLWFAAFIPVPFLMRQGITRVSSLVFIGCWMAVQLGLGIHAFREGGAQVAYWGHIGGFLLGFAVAASTRQWRQGGLERLLKEADHQFYRQRWYPALELYQQLAKQYPHCVEAVTKWALCWECAGLPARAEKVLQDAVASYQQQGLCAEAAIVARELAAMQTKAAAPATPATAAAPAPPNLMFRREFKWKGKRA